MLRVFIVRVTALETDCITAESRLTDMVYVLAAILWRWLIMTTRKEILCSTKLLLNETLNNRDKFFPSLHEFKYSFRRTPGPSICNHSFLIVVELANFALVTTGQQTNDIS